PVDRWASWTLPAGGCAKAGVASSSFFSWSKVPWRRLVCYTARRVIAVAKQKGRVGKVATVIDLAPALALRDLVLDPRGSAPTGRRAGLESGGRRHWGRGLGPPLPGSSRRWSRAASRGATS